jgi:hypothetical protein
MHLWRSNKVAPRHSFAIAVAWLAVSASAQAAITITSPGTLPNATAGASYSFTFTATGGVQPLTWSESGNFPQGLQLAASTGVISGTPSQAGAYSFTVQVVDSTGASVSGTFSLTVAAGGLTITTVAPLFTATVGTFYSFTFTAAGGTPPYTWSITAGQIAPLTLNPSTGVLTGTPTAAGNLSFTIQVADSAGKISSQAFTLTVNVPQLVVLTPAALSNGTVGIGYSVTLSASGGVPPYTWNLVSGQLPQLNLSTAGVLSGTPQTAGAYTFTIGVTDSAGNNVTRVFSLTIQPTALTITTASPLPAATAGSAYSATLAATGGVPPYTWSATGLPSGLTIDPGSGTVSGTPVAAGSFSVAIRVADNNQTISVSSFQVNVALPAVPSLTVTGPQAQAQPGSQVPIQLVIGGAYPGTISGQVSISFAPSKQGVTDSTIQFSTGGTTAVFSILAGQTTAAYSAPGSTQTSSTLALQTGTLAGVITLTYTVQAFGVNLTSQVPSSQTITVPTAAPGITSVQSSTSGQTITIQIIGFSDTLELSQAMFSFSANGATLKTSQFTVSVGSNFTTWYQSSAAAGLGSQFMLTQTFTAQGDPTTVSLQSVSLVNTSGTTTSSPSK